MKLWLALAGMLFPVHAALAAISGVPVPVSAYLGPCDTVSGCAAAYSMTRAMRAAYTGNLFQLYNGSTTLDVGQLNHVVDTSGIATFCAGANCLYSKIYDQINNADLVPTISGTIDAPAQCTSGNSCAAPLWIDTTTGLPIVATVFPSEYHVAAPAVNAGANPLSQMWYGRNDWYPAQFSIGHAPNVADINGTDFGSMVGFNDHPTIPVAPWTSGYFQCATATAECVGADEETTVDPYTPAIAPGGTGATYANSSQGDIIILATWNGVSQVNLYANSSTPRFTGSPPASVQFDGSPLIPGNDIKLGCGGDCIHNNVIFREGLVANATFTGSDYTAVQNNITAFYSAHTTAAQCQGGADLFYSTGIKSDGGMDWQSYFPGPGSTLLSYALAQTRASYFGPIADLNNGSTTQTFNGALAAGSAGCGLDPAAATFCNPSCTVVKLYNQGSWSQAGVGNVHDATLDVTFAVGQRPTVTFNSLNGLPTMHFSGAQYGCITLTGNAGGYYAHSAVARRTSGSSFSNVLFIDVDPAQVGFNTAGNAGFYGGTSTINQAATESHWHAIMYENGTGLSYVDGVSGSVVNTNKQNLANTEHFCIGATNTGTQALTGDVAEVDVGLINSHAAVEYTSQGAAMFSTMQGVWGTLPN